MVMINDEEQWKSAIREASLLPEAPIQQKSGRWKITNRLVAWKSLGPRIFDDYLDRFQKIAVEVLRERNSQFDIDPDQRFTASLHEKALNHSDGLRNGLAETLALLGSYPEYLTSCSVGRAEYIARQAVQEILQDADWKLWASLNDILPLLAEAAPNEFLDSVEKSLNTDPNPFEGVFAQEGSGFVGRTYITGLLWALESLAWDTELLTRVVIILGELAAIDPGGNWGNRPANSLSTILLPWFPQTLASVSKRRVAITTLQAEFPEVAWKLLLKLLPNIQQSSSMTRKPSWRKIIPDDWSESVTNQDYIEQVNAYAELAINQAKQDRLKLATLVNYFNSLPPAAQEHLISFLGSEEVVSLPQEERLPIWNELTNFVSKHRKFSNAKWAMSSEKVNIIAAIVDRIEPDSPDYKHQRLFNQRDFDLHEEKGNYQQEVEKLHLRRRDAVNEIYGQGGVQSVIKFAETVDAAWQVGFVFGEVVLKEDESEIFPVLLESVAKNEIQFASGFVSGRFRTQGWAWIDQLDLNLWNNNHKAVLLAYLPFNSETWTRARELLGNQEGEYWSKTHANPYDIKDGLPEAVDKLIDNQRIPAAISVIEKAIFSDEPIHTSQITRVFDELLQLPEEIRSSNLHAIATLIKFLQDNPDTDQDELFKIEWSFLTILDGSFGIHPRLLQKKISQDPAFFCDILRVLFRSDKDNETSLIKTQEHQAIITNAYRLLSEWRTPPGSLEDGTFDGHELNSWLDRVKSICAESGHLEIAMGEVGRVLFYSPQDPDGLWLHRSVASVLNEKDAEKSREGFAMEIFNSRGAHFVDPEGKPERDLAEHYRQQAEEVELNGFYRLATTLRKVAAEYDLEARRILVRMRFDE
jgi:hypothetical protein